MAHEAARMTNIIQRSAPPKKRVFTSAVSATASICLFVLLGVKLLESL